MSNISKTMKSFAHSTGQSANAKAGTFSGSLLGKAAEGMEALEAIASLVEAKVNRFMELAIKAANVAKQTLAAAHTIPFANPDLEFNASITHQAPSLGGTSSRKAMKKPSEDKKDE
jgi:hypothetical protein